MWPFTNEVFLCKPFGKELLRTAQQAAELRHPYDANSLLTATTSLYYQAPIYCVLSNTPAQNSFRTGQLETSTGVSQRDARGGTSKDTAAARFRAAR